MVWTIRVLVVSTVSISKRPRRTRGSILFFFISSSFGKRRDIYPLPWIWIGSALPTFPRLCISFRLWGDLIPTIAWVFYRFVATPQWLTMNPMNLPDPTPKAHFSKMSFILYFLMLCVLSWVFWHSYHVVHINLHRVPDYRLKNLLHQPLIYCTRIFKAEWHYSITEQTWLVINAVSPHLARTSKFGCIPRRCSWS